jgi:hypothetical protein
MISGAAANVLDFGAVGDGVTDDTAAIQACFDSLAGGEYVVFPEGTYSVTSTVTVPVGCFIFGYGAHLVRTSPGNDQILYVIGTITDVLVAGLELSGNDTGSQGVGLRFSTCTRATAQDIIIHDCWNGSSAIDCSQIIWDGVQLQDLKAYGVVPTDCDLVIVNNVIAKDFTGPNGAAVESKRCREIVISNVVIENIKDGSGTGGHGINIRAADTTATERVAISNITIDGVDKAGIFCHIDDSTSSMEGVTVSNVNADDVGFSVIQLTGDSSAPMKQVSVTGVTCTGSALTSPASLAYLDVFRVDIIANECRGGVTIKSCNNGVANVILNDCMYGQATAGDEVLVVGAQGSTDNICNNVHIHGTISRSVDTNGSRAFLVDDGATVGMKNIQADLDIRGFDEAETVIFDPKTLAIGGNRVRYRLAKEPGDPFNELEYPVFAASPGTTGTLAVDVTLPNKVYFGVLTGNITISNPLAPLDGQTLELSMRQAAASSFTVTFSYEFKTDFSMGATNNSFNTVTFRYVDAASRWLQVAKAENLT